MRRINERCPQVLRKIEEQKGQPVSKEMWELLAAEFQMGDVKPWKDQLMQCVECYTTGDTTRLATTANERNIFTTWSRIADKGHSLRQEHVTDMRCKAHSPKACVPANNLELAIPWKKKRCSLRRPSARCFRPRSGPCTSRSKDFGEARFGTYEAIKVEILSLLADEARHPRGKLAMVMGAPRPTATGRR